MPVPTRFFIERGPAFEPTPHYLHVFEVEGDDRADGGFEWQPDRTGALRFASRQDAEAFGHLHLDGDFFAVSHPAADVDRDAPQDCACTAGWVCRHNAACPRLPAPEIDRAAAVA